MAAIREILTLEDKFSAAFSKYISLGTDAAASTKAVKDAAQRATAASKIQAAAMNAAAASAKAQTAELKRQKAEQELLAKSSDDLIGKLKSLAGAYIGMQSVQAVVGLSDTLTQTTARLDLMNDGLQTTAELQKDIYDSANRSRSLYLDTADAIAKMALNAGAAFNGNQEVISFMEQINKQFVIAGASTEDQKNAVRQLTQAMAAGTLRGEELNSILDSAPGIARAIESYMGIAEGSIKEYAEEGKITSDVVKNAMFAAAEETNQKFESMPMTWAQVWTQFKNTAIKAFDPVLTAINWTANHLDIIAPIVLGIAGAFTVFMIATKGAAAATAIMTIAQQGLNAVMMMNPIGLIIMAVVLLISIFYAVIAVINEVTGSSISATGLIAGAIATVAAVIANIVIGLLNGIIQLVWTLFVSPFLGYIEFVLNAANGGFNGFGGMVANLIGNIISWFLNLGKIVTTIIDAIFGTDWTAGLNSLQNSVLQWGKNENAITISREAPTIERFNYGDVWNGAYNWGANLFSGNSVLDTQVPEVDPYTDENEENDEDVAKSVNSIEKAVNLSQEDLQSLVELAERQYVNNINLIAQTPVINITGANTGRTAADRQNLADTIRDILIEQVAAGSVRSTSRAY